jgi:TonB family protein
MYFIKTGLRVVAYLLACSVLTSPHFAQSKNPKIGQASILKSANLQVISSIDSQSEISQHETDKPGKSRDKGAEDLTPYERAKDLLQTIGLNNPVPVQFENQTDSPVVVLDASLLVKKTRRHTDSSEEDYVIQAQIHVSNATNKIIKAFGLYFVKAGDKQPDNPFIAHTHIDANNLCTFQTTNEIDDLMWLKKPEQLLIKVAGIVFADNSIWEEQPESKYIFDQLYIDHPDSFTREVEAKPVALTALRPNYTEEARQNKVEGSVSVRALVGADGKVKRVRIISGLPDGLNEETILAVKQMLFKPALKADQPVDYWMVMTVEFRL